ncbi:MAG: translation initiation factor IF-2 [Desulfovibrio sp.]|nr:translation initiation factor IF-2 [Desulfovibrio sp.]|tara:strand:+ start:25940 stop:26722 length:783 start_codon:yes stop_codon:yes gene_type:complete
MDRRERLDDPVEAYRAAMEGMLAEAWTAMPGIVQSFDPDAETVTIQPSIRGRIEQPDGSVVSVNLPLLVDVPAVFPGGGGFTLTFPVKVGDEALVVFACRCIDSWWQSGGIGEPLEPRMHNLSDGFALVGPRSQPRTLPNVSTEDVQLRTDDGQASITIKPDYTINASNPGGSINMPPDGNVTGTATQSILLEAPFVGIAADAFSLASLDGGNTTAVMKGDLNHDGKIDSTGDHVAGGTSLQHHLTTGVVAGDELSGEPQ